MPATAFVRNRADVRPAIERVGGAPVVIKLLEGTQGIGVILAPQVKVAEAIIETLHSTNQNVLIQRFVRREPWPRHPCARGRRPRRRRHAAHRERRRVPLERAPRRQRRGRRAHAGIRAGRRALGPDHGPQGRRRRHARGRRRSAGHGGQLLARSGGHRDGRRTSTWPAPSSTTSPTRSRSPTSTCASVSPSRAATVSPSWWSTPVLTSSVRRSASRAWPSATSRC